MLVFPVFRVLKWLKRPRKLAFAKKKSACPKKYLPGKIFYMPDCGEFLPYWRKTPLFPVSQIDTMLKNDRLQKNIRSCGDACKGHCGIVSMSTYSRVCDRCRTNCCGNGKWCVSEIAQGESNGVVPPGLSVMAVRASFRRCRQELQTADGDSVSG